MLFVFMRTLLRDVTWSFRFNARDLCIAMSVGQVMHELQEQLQRVSAEHQATHQELTTLREVARPVGGGKDLDARPVWKEERFELENLVVSGERLRRRGARSAEADDEGRREPEAASRFDTPSA